jgi:hypothetical protein
MKKNEKSFFVDERTSGILLETTMCKAFRYAVIASVCLALAACGGGDSSAPSPVAQGMPTTLAAHASLSDGNATAADFHIVPPNAILFGKTYSQWAGSFWQWALALPLAGHPFAACPDPNDSAAFAKQQSGNGHVWYWSAPDGPLTCYATLPVGKALFLTIRDIETSTLEAPPFYGATEADRRENSKWWADHIVNVFVTIDGVPVENLQAYRLPNGTADFEFTAPTPWIFGDTGGKGRSVADGYYVMFDSLPKGNHTIHYGGTFHFKAGEIKARYGSEIAKLFGNGPLDFPKDITIQLTVR